MIGREPLYSRISLERTLTRNRTMSPYRGLLLAVLISLLCIALAEIPSYQYTNDNDVTVKSSFINDKYQKTPRVVRVYTQDSYPHDLSVPSEVFEGLLEPKKLIVLPTREDLQLLTQLYDYPQMYPNNLNPQYAITYMSPKLMGYSKNYDYGYRVYAYKLKPQELLKVQTEKKNLARFAPFSRWQKSNLPSYAFVSDSEPSTRSNENVDKFGCISNYGDPPCITPPLVFGYMNSRTRTDSPYYHAFVSNTVPKTQQQAWPVRGQRYFKEHDASSNLEELYYPFAARHAYNVAPSATMIQDSVNDYNSKYRYADKDEQPSEENMEKLMQIMTSLNFLRPGEYFTRVILSDIPAATQQKQQRQAAYQEEIPLQEAAKYRQVLMIQDEPNIEKVLTYWPVTIFGFPILLPKKKTRIACRVYRY